jgi:hypothetical protein
VWLVVLGFILRNNHHQACCKSQTKTLSQRLCASKRDLVFGRRQCRPMAGRRNGAATVHPTPSAGPASLDAEPMRIPRYRSARPRMRYRSGNERSTRCARRAPGIRCCDGIMAETAMRAYGRSAADQGKFGSARRHGCGRSPQVLPQWRHPDVKMIKVVHVSLLCFPNMDMANLQFSQQVKGQYMDIAKLPNVPACRHRRRCALRKRVNQFCWRARITPALAMYWAAGADCTGARCGFFHWMKLPPC